MFAGVSWFGLKAQAGLNAVRSPAGEYGLSADFRLNAGKTDIFGEAAWTVGAPLPKGLVGAVWNIEYDVKIAGRAAYAGGKASAALGAQFREAFASAEAAVNKGEGTVKYLVNAPFRLRDGISATFRLKGRLEAGKRPSNTFRATFDGTAGNWKMRLLADAGIGEALTGLIYLEPGYVTDRFSLYARATLFAADNWDQRIYIYERDAPGNFNMKAYCGRGWAASAVAGWKIKRQKLHLRACLTDSTRETRLEFHGQYSIDF